jgi:hypothetical protein
MRWLIAAVIYALALWPAWKWLCGSHDPDLTFESYVGVLMLSGIMTALAVSVRQDRRHEKNSDGYTGATRSIWFGAASKRHISHYARWLVRQIALNDATR